MQKRMEIITIESSAFKELTEQIREIAAFVRKYEPAAQSEGKPRKEYLISKEVCEMLGISNRTLQRMRDARVFNFTYVGNACRYRRNDIEKYLKERGMT